MNKQQITEKIGRELAEYRTLTGETKQAEFWGRVHVSDEDLTKEDRSVINEVILDGLQKAIVQTKFLLEQTQQLKAAQ